MPTINMQFHVLPEEFAEFILTATENDLIYFTIISGKPPISPYIVSREQFKAELIRRSLEKSNFGLTIYILLTQPNLSPTTYLKFIDQNPYGIIADIGLLSEKGLGQAGLSTTNISNSAIYEVAKKIANKIKKCTHAGVTAINVENDARSLAKSFRYSDGAMAMEKEGIAMLPIAGGGKLVLGDVTHK